MAKVGGLGQRVGRQDCQRTEGEHEENRKPDERCRAHCSKVNWHPNAEDNQRIRTREERDPTKDPGRDWWTGWIWLVHLKRAKAANRGRYQVEISSVTVSAWQQIQNRGDGKPTQRQSQEYIRPGIGSCSARGGCSWSRKDCWIDELWYRIQ